MARRPSTAGRPGFQDSTRSCHEPSGCRRLRATAVLPCSPASAGVFKGASLTHARPLAPVTLSWAFLRARHWRCSRSRTWRPPLPRAVPDGGGRGRADLAAHRAGGVRLAYRPRPGVLPGRSTPHADGSTHPGSAARVRRRVRPRGRADRRTPALHGPARRGPRRPAGRRSGMRPPRTGRTTDDQDPGHQLAGGHVAPPTCRARAGTAHPRHRVSSGSGRRVRGKRQRPGELPRAASNPHRSSYPAGRLKNRTAIHPSTDLPG